MNISTVPHRSDREAIGGLKGSNFASATGNVVFTRLVGRMAGVCALDSAIVANSKPVIGQRIRA
jgi:hypothetical protein